MTGVRIKPENRRAAETFDVEFQGVRYALTVGHLPGDSSPIEVFVSCSKIASDLEALARDAGIAISIALQYGAPPEVLRDALGRDTVDKDGKGAPVSIVGAVLDAISEKRDEGRLQ